MTDASGNDISDQGSYPFGESWYSNNMSTNSQWVFTTYQRDQESGLDYALARFYDSRMGSFCSADPVEGDPNDPQTWNRYAYARNNPLNITDPSGQDWVDKLIESFVDIMLSYAGMPTWIFGDVIVNFEGELGSRFPSVDILPTLAGAAAFSQGQQKSQQASQQKEGKSHQGPPGSAPPQQAKKVDCPPVPPHPETADVDANIRATESAIRIASITNTPGKAQEWWVSRVNTDGPWDYKAQPPGFEKYDDFGNFNYGATGSLFFSLATLERGAVGARLLSRPYSQFKNYGFSNDPHKNEMIRLGMQYRKNNCGKFN